MICIPETKAQIHIPINKGKPMNINIKGRLTTDKTSCITPSEVLPPMIVPKPGITNIFKSNAAIAIP